MAASLNSNHSTYAKLPMFTSLKVCLACSSYLFFCVPIPIQYLVSASTSWVLDL